MKSRHKKIKIGQLPGDLPPEQYREFPSMKAVIARKTRRQLKRQEIKELERAGVK
jgi:hypothetical protein